MIFKNDLLYQALGLIRHGPMFLGQRHTLGHCFRKK